MVQEEPASSSWQGRTAAEEVAFLRAQEQSVLLHQARNYRDGEEWEVARALDPDSNPARVRRQGIVTVEASVTQTDDQEGPRLSRSWSLEVPEAGTLRLAIRFGVQPEQDQDEIDTVITPATKRRRCELAEQAAAADPQLNYGQFAALYKKWRGGTLLDRQVVNVYGRELLDFFEAQYALADFDTEGDRPDGVSGDGFALQPVEPGDALTSERYDRVYGLWVDGWVSDEQVCAALGPDVLNLVACQRLTGTLPERVWAEQLQSWVILLREGVPALGSNLIARTEHGDQSGMQPVMETALDVLEAVPGVDGHAESAGRGLQDGEGTVDAVTGDAEETEGIRGE
eukprot:s303_g15.t1